MGQGGKLEEAVMAAGWEYVHLFPPPVSTLVTVVDGRLVTACGSLLGMQPVEVSTHIHPLPFSHVSPADRSALLLLWKDAHSRA